MPRDLLRAFVTLRALSRSTYRRLLASSLNLMNSAR